jgi:hypothetical protein
MARELRTRAADMRGLLLRQREGAREALQALLVDRVECMPVLIAGTRGYAFTGNGAFGGLLAASTWPTTYGGPNGTRTLLYSGISRSYKGRIGQIGLSSPRDISRNHMSGRWFKSRARNHRNRLA